MLSQPKYLHNRPRERVMPIGVGMKFNIALDAGFTRIPCLHRGRLWPFPVEGEGIFGSSPSPNPLP